MNAVALSRFLGLFSLALGAVEVIIPRTLARGLGLRGGPWLVRAFGLREIGAGLTILTQPDSIIGPSSRVGGDVLDIVVLADACNRPNRNRDAAEIALAVVLGVTGVDILCTSLLVSGERRRHATAVRTRVGEGRK